MTSLRRRGPALYAAAEVGWDGSSGRSRSRIRLGWTSAAPGLEPGLEPFAAYEARMRGADAEQN